jgi:hypothetical protein
MHHRPNQVVLIGGKAKIETSDAKQAEERDFDQQ